MQPRKIMKKMLEHSAKAFCIDGESSTKHQTYVVSGERSAVQSQKNYVNWVDKEWFKGPKLADKLKRTEKEARPLDLATSQSLIFFRSMWVEWP